MQMVLMTDLNTYQLGTSVNVWGSACLRTVAVFGALEPWCDSILQRLCAQCCCAPCRLCWTDTGLRRAQASPASSPQERLTNWQQHCRLFSRVTTAAQWLSGLHVNQNVAQWDICCWCMRVHWLQMFQWDRKSVQQQYDAGFCSAQGTPCKNVRHLYDELARPDTSCCLAPGLFTAAETLKNAMQVGSRPGSLGV